MSTGPGVTIRAAVSRGVGIPTSIENVHLAALIPHLEAGDDPMPTSEGLTPGDARWWDGPPEAAG